MREAVAIALAFGITSFSRAEERIPPETRALWEVIRSVQVLREPGRAAQATSCRWLLQPFGFASRSRPPGRVQR